MLNNATDSGKVRLSSRQEAIQKLIDRHAKFAASHNEEFAASVLHKACIARMEQVISKLEKERDSD